MVKRGVDRRSFRDKLHWSSLPPGIKVLIAYAGIIAFFYLAYLLFGVTKPVSVIFGRFIYGGLATVIEIVSLITLIAIIYGLIQRHFWVFYLSVAWFSFGLINAVVSLARFNSEFDVLRNILFASSFVVIILNGVIAGYIYSERKYFKTKHLNKETRTKDRVFVYIIVTFMIVSLLILTTFCINFYKTTLKTTKGVIEEVQGSAQPEILCAQKVGAEKDICYLVLSVISDEKDTDICENIESDFYKITCYRSIQ